MDAATGLKSMSPEDWRSVKDRIYHWYCHKGVSQEDLHKTLNTPYHRATLYKLKEKLKEWHFKKGESWDNYPFEKNSGSSNHIWLHGEASVLPTLEAISGNGAQASSSGTGLHSSRYSSQAQPQIPHMQEEEISSNVAHQSYSTVPEGLTNDAPFAPKYNNEPQQASMEDPLTSYSSGNFNASQAGLSRLITANTPDHRIIAAADQGSFAVTPRFQGDARTMYDFPSTDTTGFNERSFEGFEAEDMWTDGLTNKFDNTWVLEQGYGEGEGFNG
ncbi:MAG: hypothetical protein M1812_006701 [Candelaria pacifica]|nr:MAG: hypothetical protein M1812_006701 [Candelaria pacifica]